jgi:hypothetical protein
MTSCSRGLAPGAPMLSDAAACTQIKRNRAAARCHQPQEAPARARRSHLQLWAQARAPNTRSPRARLRCGAGAEADGGGNSWIPRRQPPSRAAALPARPHAGSTPANRAARREDVSRASCTSMGLRPRRCACARARRVRGAVIRHAMRPRRAAHCTHLCRAPVRALRRALARGGARFGGVRRCSVQVPSAAFRLTTQSTPAHARTGAASAL